MKRGALIAAGLLAGLVAQGASASPSVYLRLNAGGNDVVGDSPVVSLERADTIECLAFSMGIVSPREPGGKQTGPRAYEAVTITKEIDRSSTALLEALTRNQSCRCEFMFFRTGPTDQEEQHYTIVLERAYISSIRQYVREEDALGGPLAPVVEEVAFTVREITWTWLDGGLQHSDVSTGDEGASAPASSPRAPLRLRQPGAARPSPRP